MASVSPRQTSASSNQPIHDPANAPLLDYIRQSAKAIQRTEFTVGLLSWLVLGLATIVSFVLIDHWVLPFNEVSRYAVWLLLVGGSLYWLLFRIFPLVGRSINPEYAAKRIEDTIPEMKDGLISWLQLASRETTPRGVLNAVGRYVAKHLQGQEVASVIDQFTSMKLAAMLFGLILISAIYLAVSPKSGIATIGRLMMPWATIAPSTRVQILDLSPGDATVTEGSNLHVTLQVSGWRRGDVAQIRYATEDGQTVDQTVAMRAEIEGLTYAADFGKSFGGLVQPMRYFVEAGDAKAGPFVIRIQAVPLVLLEQVEYTYPAYMRLAPRISEGDGRIEAPEGTRVIIRAKSNQPIKRARIEYDTKPTKDGAFNIASADDVTIEERSISAPLLLELDAAKSNPTLANYRIRSTNERGEENSEPVVYPIKVIPDLAPEVQLASDLKETIDLPANQKLDLEVRAMDPDFGLVQLSIAGKADHQNIISKELFRNETGVNAQVSEVYSFDPSSLRLRPGMQTEIVATAQDNRRAVGSDQLEPNIRQSRVIRIRITPPVNDSLNPQENNKSDKANKKNSLQDKSEKNEGQKSKPSEKNTTKTEKSEKTKEEKSANGQRENNQDQNSGEKKESGDKNASPDKNQAQQGPQDNNSSSPEQSKQAQPGDNQANDGQSSDSKSSNGQSSDGQSGAGQSGAGQSGAGQSGSMKSDTDSRQGGAPSDGADAGNQAPAGQDSSSGNSNSGNNSSARRGPSQSGGPKHDGEAFEELRDAFEESGELSDAPGAGKSTGKSSTDRNDSKSAASSESPSGDSNPDESSSKKSASGKNGSSSKETSSDGAPSSEKSDLAGPEKSMGQGKSDSQSADRNQVNSDSQTISDGQSKGGSQESIDGKKEPSGAQRDLKANGSKSSSTSEAKQSNADKRQGDQHPQGDSKKGADGQAHESENRNSGGDPTESKTGAGSKSGDKGNVASEQTDGSGGKEASDQKSADGKESSDSDSAAGKQGTSNSLGTGKQGGKEQGSNSAQANDQIGSSSDRPRDAAPSSSSSNAGKTSKESTGNRLGKDRVGPDDPASDPGNEAPKSAEQATAEVEYARQATDLVLKALDRQRDQPDPELLRRMGWNKEQLQAFLDRWKNARDQAANNPQKKREYDEALRSLGLLPNAGTTRNDRGRDDQLRGLNEEGSRVRPPETLRERFEAFRKSTMQ